MVPSCWAQIPAAWCVGLHPEYYSITCLVLAMVLTRPALTRLAVFEEIVSHVLFHSEIRFIVIVIVI